MHAQRQPPILKSVRKYQHRASSFPGIRRFHWSGFTYLELIFVILIISTLVSMMLVRVLPAIDRAERASVLQLEGQIRSSLAVTAAKYLANGDQDRVRLMDGMNPMELMLEPPRNYVGEREGARDVPEGSWFFRTDQQQLRYRPRKQSSVQYADIPLSEVVFHVEVAEAEFRDGKELYGVRLSRVAGEDWLVATPQ